VRYIDVKPISKHTLVTTLYLVIVEWREPHWHQT